MNKWIVFVTLLCVSCLDLELESPYEDLNGIFLEHIRTYGDIQGCKLEIDNSTGYVCSWSQDVLGCFDFSNVYTISPISSYVCASNQRILDFTADENYVYIGIGDYAYPESFEIVDFNQAQPALVGSIEISHGPFIVTLHGSYAYVAGEQNITVVDVRVKTNPDIVAVHQFESGILGLELDSNYAYVLLNNNDFHILDISEPSQIHAVWSTSLLDTAAHPDFFALNGHYIYAAIWEMNVGYMINAYHITDSPGLEYVAALEMPNQIRNLFTKDTIGLASLWDFNTYLLNLKYPALPCVSEILHESAWYGIVKDSYIYLLTPSLKIFEIKEVEQ